MSRFASVAVAVAALLSPAPSKAGVDESAAYATITTMTPMVRVKLKADADPVAATAEMKLPEGAQVITLAGGACELKFSRAHIVRLGPSTTITVQRLPKKSAARILVQLLAGRARAMVDRMKAEGDFGMYASTTITAVKGTDYEMSRSPTGEVDVEVNEGKVDTAETEGEDLAAVEKAFGLVLMGQIGMRLMEGQRVRTAPGARMGRPEKMVPRTPLGSSPRGGRDATGVERGARGGRDRGEATGGRERRTKTPKGDRGGKGGGGGGLPSLPGGGGFGF